MSAGTRRHRVVIEQPTSSRTGTGAVQQTWGPYATVWAEIEWVDGIEQIQADQMNARQVIRVTIEASRELAAAYKGGITQQMRLAYRGQYFEIQSVAPVDGRNRKLVLNCMERA